MNGLIALFLSGVSAASPTTPLPWFEMNDYPVQAFQQRKEGTTAFEVVVGPNGLPVGCTIDKSSGFGLLDQRACLVSMRKARFTPALGTDGRPAYGVYRSRVTWALDPANWAQMENGPDIEVNLNKLPNDRTGPIDVKYAYLVDVQGKTSGCTPITSGHPQVLDSLGCDQLARTPQAPAKLKSNVVVPVVRTAWVRFAPTN